MVLGARAFGRSSGRTTLGSSIPKSSACPASFPTLGLVDSDRQHIVDSSTNLTYTDCFQSACLSAARRYMNICTVKVQFWSLNGLLLTKTSRFVIFIYPILILLNFLSSVGPSQGVPRTAPAPLGGGGVNHIIIRTHWTGMLPPAALSSMRLLTDELLPKLRKK